ncbi:MAG: serine O-acetyltransferase [Thermoanaerobaculia bacterium]
MLDNLVADTRRLKLNRKGTFPWYVIEALLFDNGYQAVVAYRIASWFKRHGISVLGSFFARLGLFATGVDIAPGAEIGPGLIISHGTGLVVGGHTRIGARAILLHQVTLGAPEVARLDEMPRIGDDVYIGAGAALIGGITIGDRVAIGLNTIVTEDVPDDTRIVNEVRQRVTLRKSSRIG